LVKKSESQQNLFALLCNIVAVGKCIDVSLLVFILFILIINQKVVILDYIYLNFVRIKQSSIISNFALQ